MLAGELGEVDEMREPNNPCIEHHWYDPIKGRPDCGWHRYKKEEWESIDIERGCTEPCADSCLICWQSYAIHLESDKEDLDWLDEHKRDTIDGEKVWLYLLRVQMGLRYAKTLREAIDYTRSIK